MKIIEKFKDKVQDCDNAPAVTIAFLGDSITQGCFDVYIDENNKIQVYTDYEAVYHNKIKKIFSKLYPTVPLNIINAGISGNCAWDAYNRMEKDVIKHGPDLCVISFGANDAYFDNGNCIEKSMEYIRMIIDKLQQNNIEVILMTQSMMCTRVSKQLTDPHLRKIAEGVSKFENEGIFEKYMEEAKKVAKEKGVPVCDVYTKWRKLYDSGVDVTKLLANHINHPEEDMHWLFAYSLVETMFSE